MLLPNSLFLFLTAMKDYLEIGEKLVDLNNDRGKVLKVKIFKLQETLYLPLICVGIRNTGPNLRPSWSKKLPGL